MARPPSVELFFQLSLLGLIASGFLAVAGSGRLDFPTILLTSAGLLLRALLVTGVLRIRLPDRWLSALAIAYIGFYPLDYRFVSGEFLPATVHLVFFLAVMRILTATSGRDYLFAAAISLLELLAAAMISVQFNFFLWFGCYLLFGIAALASAEIRRSAARPGQVSRARVIRRLGPRLALLTGVTTAAVLVMTAGLFFLLPRTAGAALRRLAVKSWYLPGFSNEVTLGQIGEIKLRSTPVMHVRFFNKEGRFETRWRGAALSRFDGRRWFNPPAEGDPVHVPRLGHAILEDPDQRRRPGTRVLYRVDLQPMETGTLFFAGLPEVLTVPAPRVFRLPHGGYRLGGGNLDGVRYDVQAYFEGPGVRPASERVNGYIDVPPLDPRIEALARELRGLAAGEYETAHALEQALRTRYGYTIELPKTVPADPLAHFLFERRKGHCEYFASALAVMLRTLNIPSRMVTGFSGGTYNPVSGLYVVRASDAHTWVEAWILGRGWMEFDPTPPDPRSQASSMWTTIAMYADAAETFWQDWVISYDLGRQLLLADRMERTSRFGLDWLTRDRSSGGWRWNPASVKAAAPWAGGVLVLAAIAWWLGPVALRWTSLRWRVRRLRQGAASRDDASELYLRFLDLLRKRGYTKPSWYTPEEFVRTLRAPELATLAGEFTQVYQELRFGGRSEAAQTLPGLLERLESM